MTQTPTRNRPTASFRASAADAMSTPPGAARAAAAAKAAADIAALVGHCARGESHLPSSVMSALTLLAVPGSRPLRADQTISGTPTTSGTVIPREITDVRWEVLTNRLGGLPLDKFRIPQQPARPGQPEILDRPDPDVRDLPREWAAEEIDLIEAADRVTAWAQHLQIGAIARLRGAVGEYCETQLTSEACRNGVTYDIDREADAATSDEVALVTGLPVTEATRRMRLACGTDGRSRVVLSRLYEGRTTLDRCLRILDATSDCHSDDVNVIAGRVLAELPDGSKPSHQLFMRRLRRQVVLHQPDPTQRHADAVARRTAFGELLDDGSGILTITGDGERVVAALDRVDALARTLRAGGDPRNLAALRSDVALDLLLVGWPSPPETIQAARTSTSARHSTGTGGTGSANASGDTTDDTTDDTTGTGTGDGTEDRDHLDGNDDDLPAPADLVDLTPWLTLKHQPPAHVNVIVSLTTLLGEDDATAEIPGHGFITAAHARQLAMATGSVWRRLVTDPLTGAALDLSTQRYRPTRQMADLVAALDGVCRAPGCTVPARQCDIDHAVPWPHGPTAIRNLSAKHRRHHNYKTRRTWLTTQDRDGTMTWHTIGGRDYITERYRYVEPSHRPATDREHARACATDPPPF